jgi:hypothetical protein
MSQHDDLFQELGRTLDVSPSRDFSKGVHARIAHRRVVMRTTIAGFAIAASVLLAVVIRGPEPVMVSMPEVETPVVLPTTASAAGPVPAPRHKPRVTTALQRVITEVAAEPDRPLVVTNQMAILQAAWAGHSATSAVAEASPVEVMTLPEPGPIVVEPVRVLPVVIADQRVPVERLPIIRRAVAALESK